MDGHVKEPSSVLDEDFLSMAHARLVESGERERLLQQLRQQLSLCGWEEDLRKYCARIVREKGVENVTLDDLVSEVTPVARRNVPDKLHEECVSQVRQFLSREMNPMATSTTTTGNATSAGP